MKTVTKKLLSIIVVTVLLVTMISGCSNKKETVEQTANEITATPTTIEESQGEVQELGEPIQPEELGSGNVKWKETETADGWVEVTNEGGITLGYSKASGLKLIQVDGFAFKDLNKNNLLDQYEDWRLDVNLRVKSVASLLSTEDIAGLMLYSSHQFNITEELNDDQKAFLDQGVRAVLNAASSSPTDTQAKWSNAMQGYVEGIGVGIPVNFSTDPRSTGVSRWPSNLGLAATFDSSIALDAAKTLSEEYRLLGIGTLLGPQIDLASEPRWSRVSGTFGEDPALARDMTNAYVNGIQSTYDDNGNDLGWGEDSMNAMIKHWPGDGAAEAGRESHNFYGKYNVYPGGQFLTHLIPFVDGGFNLSGKTESATAVMASYSIAWTEDESLGELVGSAYSDYKINMLRDQYGFDGVICTDWGVTFDFGQPNAKPWGVEDLTIVQRIYKAIVVGVDQFGGLNDRSLVLSAYDMGVAEKGEEVMNELFQKSAARLLKNYFIVGLFENPYVNVTEANNVVGNNEALEAGYQAQLKSIVMLKNSDNTIKAATGTDKPTVYIPMVFKPAAKSFFGSTPASWNLPIDLKKANEYFNVITDTVSTELTGPKDEEGNATASPEDIIRATTKQLADCDFALVIVSSSNNAGGGYDAQSEKYIPISLQYSPYTALSENVRSESIAGDIVEVTKDAIYGAQTVKEKENRSYYGNSAAVSNSTDLELILQTVNNVPESVEVIVAINDSNPMVFSEFESKVDAIIMGFGVDNKTFLDVVSGKFEPSGLLPLQMPNDMETVEVQFEDVPRDMKCHTDANGNKYDFAFGINWSGVIRDERNAKYSVPALATPSNTGK